MFQVKIVRNVVLALGLYESHTKPNPQVGLSCGMQGRMQKHSPFRPHNLHRAANAVDSISMFLTLAL